jgi:hypothetical protein
MPPKLTAVALLYLFGQKYFIRDLVSGAVN